MRCRAAIGILPLLAGCATTEYVYQPSAPAVTLQMGRPAAQYSIPPNNSTGDCSIASFGITEIEPSQGGPKANVLVLRMVIANRTDEQPWSLDAREQILSMPAIGQVRPAFINTDAGGGPSLTLSKGEQRAVDLYYAMPPKVTSNGDLPGFELEWRLQAGAVPVVQRTSFSRMAIEPQSAPAYYDGGQGYYGSPYYSDVHFNVGFGWAPYWWYDPLWPPYRQFYYYRPVGVGPRYWGGGRYWGGPHFNYGPRGGNFGPRGGNFVPRGGNFVPRGSNPVARPPHR